MRIGINTFALSNGLGMAGPGRYIAELVRALASVAHGHELVLFANAENLALFAHHPCQLVDCGPLTRMRPVRLLWEQAALPFLARRYQIDVFHSPVFVQPLRLPCASVVTIHDMTWFLMPEMHTRVKGTYFRKMIPPSVRRATSSIATSQSAKQDMVRLLGVGNHQVSIVYHGVDLKMFHPMIVDERMDGLESKYGVRRPYLLYVGKIEPRKNVPRLIAAFNMEADRFPKYQLVLAGNPGWDYRSAYVAADDVRHRDRIKFTGFIDEVDLPALYAGADLFVYPSSYEGFGFPVVEAMACGTPVITSNLSSLPEIAGDAALLVDPSSTEDLANAIRHILSCPTLRIGMRASGLRQAGKFTWAETARQTLDVYEHAYCSSGAKPA